MSISPQNTASNATVTMTTTKTGTLRDINHCGLKIVPTATIMDLVSAAMNADLGPGLHYSTW
ncbi:unnamed protein product [Dibothriocephalus latus]|uniref:Uncharacterized protein n=1 Tax=Dibothriocephalus latus TaxID=60516 RepID=A0A3P7P7I8_DIBLA|nr:unnamed protein product [Dibothriocephalus latus]